MNKFKVGDKVKVVASQEELEDFGCDDTIKVGNTYIITDADVCNNLFELNNLHSGWVKPSSIKLADEPSSVKNKWHPHHDLIIKWLENEGSVVTPVGGVEVKIPNWHPDLKYTVTAPPTKKEVINKIKSQIKVLQGEIGVLQSKVEELEANGNS